MRPTARLAGIAGLALTTAVLFAAPAQASGYHHGAAVFVQTDNVSGNAVAVYDRAADGSLQPAGTYATGGNGGILDGSVVDHLASQGSLTLDREAGLLYAVNAGSNTITVFSVDGDHLERLQIIESGGTFPVSVTTHGDLVYVLNARDGGSIQGYRRDGHTLVHVLNWNRPLGLDPALTPEFTNTPGQVAFTPDGSKLLVTTKSNTNSVDVFAIDAYGTPATDPVVNAEPGTQPFAVTFDARGRLILAEGATNAVATFDITRAGMLTPIDVAPTGQMATCWVVRTGNKVYASNAGSNNLSGFRLAPDATLSALGNTTTNPGTVDATVTPDGQFLYVQTGANGIVDAFHIHRDGSLTLVGSVTVPDAIGGQGIAAS